METTFFQIEFFSGWAKIIALLPFILFGLRFLFFLLGLSSNFLKYRNHSKDYFSSFPNISNTLPSVSVIIPARNEEDNIKSCIESIAKCDYPKHLCELIIIDDASNDGTPSILESVKNDKSLVGEFKDFIVITISDDSEKQLPGKPGALQKGIDIAKGDLILMTDSDCTVSKEWIKSKVEVFLREKSNSKKSSLPLLIASFTLIHHNSFFSKCQGVEWLYTHAMAAAANTLGMPLGCYGNNLSADKKMMNHSDGFRGIPFSITEDLALMTFANQNGASIAYPCLRSSSVRTHPCKSLKEYLSQHQRWVKGGKSLGWKAVLFVITTLSLIIGSLVAGILGYFALAVSYIAYRIVLDTIIIWLSALRLKEYNLILWTPPSILLLIIMETALPFLLLKKNTVWKDRIYK